MTVPLMGGTKLQTRQIADAICDPVGVSTSDDAGCGAFRLAAAESLYAHPQKKLKKRLAIECRKY